MAIVKLFFYLFTRGQPFAFVCIKPLLKRGLLWKKDFDSQFLHLMILQNNNDKVDRCILEKAASPESVYNPQRRIDNS